MRPKSFFYSHWNHLKLFKLVKQEFSKFKFRMVGRIVLKIPRLPFYISHIIFFNSVLYEFMPFSNTRILSEGRYISNIKKKFSDILEEIKFLPLSPKFFIKFSNEEMDFLKCVNEDYSRFYTEIDSILLKRYINPKISRKFNFQRDFFFLYA